MHFGALVHLDDILGIEVAYAAGHDCVPGFHEVMAVHTEECAEQANTVMCTLAKPDL